MIAAIEYAAFGVVGEANILNVEIGQRFVRVEDRTAAVALLVDTQADVHRRTARLGRALVAGASADAELDRFLRELTAGITGQIRRVLEVSRGRGWLRDDVPFDELVETAAVISSLDTYLRFHLDGWDEQTYRAWARRMFLETVFRQS